MSFREKSAWISFWLILVIFGAYFVGVGMALAGRLPYNQVIGTVFVAMGIFILLEIVLHVVIAIQSPKDVRTPKDERERLIELKATRIGYAVLMPGILIVMFVLLHIVHTSWLLGNGVFFVVVLAELAKYGAEIVHFRREA